MSTHLLSRIQNFRQCRVAYQESLEVEAVVDAVISVWPGPECIAATAQIGVAHDDLEYIREIIAEHDLGCSVEKCEAALLRECEERSTERERE